jgi:ABC-2 type transport system ATP-binding protein
MSIVKLDQLTKKFGEITAVDKMTLEIEEGEIFGLLGPTGAGKSTAINMITGLLLIDKGSISILGKDIRKDKTAAKSNIGIVPRISPFTRILPAWRMSDFSPAFTDSGERRLMRQRWKRWSSPASPIRKRTFRKIFQVV